MNRIELISKIKNFSAIIIKKIKEKIENGENFKIQNEVITPHITEFSYNKGAISYRMEEKKIIKEKMDLIKGHTFIKEFCKILPEFNELFSFIKEKFQIDENFLNSLFDNFIFMLISITHEGIDDEILNNVINSFIEDLELKVPNWEVKIWIDGLWLEDEEYQINENLKLRRLRQEDIEFIKKEGYNRYEPTESASFPTTILEMKTIYKSESETQDGKRILLKSEIHKEIKIITIAFRLFRLGSVFTTRYEMRVKSFLLGGFLKIYPYILLKNRYLYGLKKRDIPLLREFIKIISQHELIEIFLINSKGQNHIYIALQRFNNAFLNAENTESIITYAISCLEALYLKKSEQGELSHRLSQRVSIIFKIFNFDSLSIYNIIKKAYKIRSLYSHGSMVKPKDLSFKNLNLEKIILNCARFSIFLNLQLFSKIDNENLFKIKIKDFHKKRKEKRLEIEKELLLKLIDDALLKEKSYLKLKQLIKKNVEFNQFFFKNNH